MNASSPFSYMRDDLDLRSSLICTVGERTTSTTSFLSPAGSLTDRMTATTSTPFLSRSRRTSAPSSPSPAPPDPPTAPGYTSPTTRPSPLGPGTSTTPTLSCTMITFFSRNLWRTLVSPIQMHFTLSWLCSRTSLSRWSSSP